MNEEIKLVLSPPRPAWLAIVLKKSPMAGLGCAAKLAPLSTGFVGSGVLLKRPLTALAMLALPDGGPGLGERDLWRRGSSGTWREELSESFLFLAGIFSCQRSYPVSLSSF